jgi:hypothetical protein
MQPQLTPDEARAALDTVERGRRRAIAEIGIPRWYWWGVALGWIALGAITDLGHPWRSAAATLVYGAGHASVAARVLDGRHGSRNLQVRRDVAGHELPKLVIGMLVVLAGLTIALSLAAQADGAEHPVTIASVVVAVIVLLGGPRLLELVRRRAA